MNAVSVSRGSETPKPRKCRDIDASLTIQNAKDQQVHQPRSNSVLECRCTLLNNIEYGFEIDNFHYLVFS